MWRRIFSIFAAVSLLLCFATVTLWVRGHWVEDDWSLSDSSGIRGVACGLGYLVSVQQQANHPVIVKNYPVRFEHLTYPPENMDRFQRLPFPERFRAGSVRVIGQETTGAHFLFLIVPTWLVATVFFILPAAWLIASRREH